MKVSASILAVKSDYLRYAKLLKYANVDYLHVDIFASEADIAVMDLLKFDGDYPPLDVHLIFPAVTGEQLDILNRANVHYLTVQYETLRDKESIKRIAETFNGNFGIALVSETPLSVVDYYINDISHLLFMCSEPGVSGAPFNLANYKRIKAIHDKYPSLHLFADGGINNIISKHMEKLGIEMVVSGSYLCHDMEQLDTNIYSLKYVDEQNIKVTRVMIKAEFLPCLSKSASFMDIINVMNRYRLGIVFLTQKENLLGIITDGDIRRGYVAFGEHIFQKKAEEIMNPKPFVSDAQKNIKEIYSELLTMRKGIDVIPVLDDGKLLGALDLRHGL